MSYQYFIYTLQQPWESDTIIVPILWRRGALEQNWIGKAGLIIHGSADWLVLAAQRRAGRMQNLGGDTGVLYLPILDWTTCQTQ